MEHEHRQRGEPELAAICPGCGAPDRFYCACTEQRSPLGKKPYKIAISRAELEIAVHHRAATGEPLQSFIRRLIRQSTEARAFRQLMVFGDTDDPRYQLPCHWGPCPQICLPPESEPNGGYEEV